jgi:hypothetical protein
MKVRNNLSKKNITGKINLKGGLNCNIVTDQQECIKRKPECLWNFTKKTCLDNPNFEGTAAPVQAAVVENVRAFASAGLAVPVKESKIPDKFKTTFFISPQLERLSTQLGITQNMREAVDPEISNDELDMLLNNIKIESDKKETLIVIADQIIREKNIVDPQELINIKIKVLLDNLAKKLCRCTQKIDEEEKEGASAKKVSSEAICRNSIFHKRGIDYITHDCGDADLNVPRFNYKMGPLLRPSVTSTSNILLRRHIPKRK